LVLVVRPGHVEVTDGYLGYGTRKFVFHSGSSYDRAIAARKSLYGRRK